ncbi:MAG: hypothetical protein DRR00_05255 [Candidatus Parabeggiatoa sp. nov. 3]|nr:MAG: hypothetical protein DRR00_05255 [Gammaproteobacteria bacterium]
MAWNPRFHLNATFVKGFRGGMPLPNPTYSGVVGANRRVRPGLTIKKPCTFNRTLCVIFFFFLRAQRQLKLYFLPQFLRAKTFVRKNFCSEIKFII